ncbi:MAG: LacI family transcriptional regulator [Oscillibacter sp.]|jgi:DNA-binding LacI/PurR family transcriptional regulator|nr:LacI family transcriptional regulator [Oscillibacter sp.]
MVSIKDISAACGVSTATVSKALNGAHDVSEETRERICAAAEEMGYRPNAAARSLKTKRTYDIGVLFKDEAGSGLTHEYFSAVLEGFKNEAESKGFDITFINTNNETMSYLDHCVYRNVDGVAIVCAPFADPKVLELAKSNLPVVTIDYVFNGKTAVLSDNLQGITDLFRHVYSLGHRKIAYIHGAPSGVTETRTVGFYRAAEEAHLEIPDAYVREGVFHDPATCARITAELLNLKDPPTCILFPDDFSALGGIREIRQKGLRIPEDISVAGYDGIHMSQVLDPPLTTLHQKTRTMGAAAARQLIEQIEHPKTTLARTTVIGGDLWEGKSVAPLKSK